jgi:hypothetical protein
MVLPSGDDPQRYKWPADGAPALIHERGTPDDDLLRAVAAELLLAGAPSVVAIREVLLEDYDPRIFFELEAQHVAA